MTTEEATRTLGVSAGCSCRRVEEQAYALLARSLDPRGCFRKNVMEAVEALAAGSGVPSGSPMSAHLKIHFLDLIRMEQIPFTCAKPPRCKDCRNCGPACLPCRGTGRIPGSLMRMATGGNRCPHCNGTGRDRCQRETECLQESFSAPADTIMVDISPEILSSSVSTVRCGTSGGRDGSSVLLTIEVDGAPSGVSTVGGLISLPAKVPVPTYVLGGDTEVSVAGLGVTVFVQPLARVAVSKPAWSVLPIAFRIEPTFPVNPTQKQRILYEELLLEEQSKGG